MLVGLEDSIVRYLNKLTWPRAKTKKKSFENHRVVNNQILLHILGEPDVSGITRYFRDYPTFLSNIRPDQILNKPLPLGTGHWSGQNTGNRLVCKSQNRWLRMTKMRWWWGLDGVGWWWPVEQWVDKTCSAALLSPSLSTGLPLLTTRWLLYLYLHPLLKQS